jgi:hypothetical protein
MGKHMEIQRVKFRKNGAGNFEIAPNRMSNEQLLAATRAEYRKWQKFISPQAGLDNLKFLEFASLFEQLDLKADGSTPPSDISSWKLEAARGLIARATKGDKLADYVLREAAVLFMARQLPLPVELGGYISKVLLQKHELGKRINGANFLRDYCIAYLVHQVLRHSKERISQTRNKSRTGKDSACTIVAKATNMGEDSVEAIWSKYKRNYPAVAAVTY